MKITGDESEVITLQQATDWTQNYRTVNTSGTKALLFGINQLMKILNQQDCMAIRAYYAIDDLGAQQLVLVGVDSNGSDIYNGVILDRAVLCPTCCDTASPLY